MVKKPAKRSFKGANSKAKKFLSENEATPVLERIEKNVKLLASGYDSLRIEMRQGFNKVWNKFDFLDEKFAGINHRFDGVDQRFDSLEQEMRSNFKTILEHLLNIDNELVEIKTELKKLNEGKTDKQVVVVLEQRLTRLEFEFNECKQMLVAAKKN
jgi:hypothetical protein